MSLLTETVSTVVQASKVNIGATFNIDLANVGALDGYYVGVGSIEPRAVGSKYLVVNEETKEPIVLPPNSVPYKLVFVPIVPLQSPNLSLAALSPRFTDDTQFTNVYDAFGWQALGDQIMPSGCSVLASTAITAYELSNFVGFPYLFITVNSASFTAGKVTIYMYYKTLAI